MVILTNQWPTEVNYLSKTKEAILTYRNIPKKLTKRQIASKDEKTQCLSIVKVFKMQDDEYRLLDFSMHNHNDVTNMLIG